MTDLRYTRVVNEDGENITLYTPNGLKVADESHPNYDAILASIEEFDPEFDELAVADIAELFDIAQAAARRFERLGTRVTAANGRIYLDGDEVDNALTKQVLRFLDEGVDDWRPLVNFFERVQANPNEDSKSQLFEFLNANDFTITEAGFIVGYKGVHEQNGEYVSVSSGPAIVNGEAVNGKVPQPLGGVVEMSRSNVHHDPSVACSTGLHVANYQYASTWTNVAAVLEVHVDPRDVVSVPRDHGHSKVRVCRYRVVGAVDTPYAQASVAGTSYDPDADEAGDVPDPWGVV